MNGIVSASCSAGAVVWRSRHSCVRMPPPRSRARFAGRRRMDCAIA